jgi:hypothetical protein
VNIKKIRGDHRTILEDIAAIVDTGANVIIGDPSQVDNLHLTLGGKAEGRGYYSCEFLLNSHEMFLIVRLTVPCNDFPTISFYFGGGKTFRIPASILNLGPTQTGSPNCLSGIVGRGEHGELPMSILDFRG